MTDNEIINKLVKFSYDTHYPYPIPVGDILLSIYKCDHRRKDIILEKVQHYDLLELLDPNSGSEMKFTANGVKVATTNNPVESIKTLQGNHQPNITTNTITVHGNNYSSIAQNANIPTQLESQTNMNFKKDKENRLKFLREIYKISYKEAPSSPESVFFGLSKDNKYNFKTGQMINNDDEKGGFIVGRELGLDEQEVENIVSYFSNRNYMSATLGLKQFSITFLGIRYLETLEEEVETPIQSNNQITIDTINAPLQLLQGSNNSTQTQNVHYSQENIHEFFSLLKADIVTLKAELQEDFNSEIAYVVKQQNKGKDVKQQLLNIGGLMKDIGMNVFGNVIASPIFEVIKPLLGL
jgi:hypothetical protein